MKKEKFHVSHGNSQPMSQKTESVENAVKGEARSVHETYAEMNEISNRIQKLEESIRSCMMPEERAEWIKARGVTLEVTLNYYLKSELVEFAKDLHLRKISGLNKAGLVKRIADYLLLPSTMREKLCTIDDDVIALFEKIAGSETLYPIDEYELWMLEELVEMNYIILRIGNMAEIPIDVRETYECINTMEFQNERRKIVWMLKCLYVARTLYAVTPMRILRKIFRKNSMFKAEIGRLTEIFEMVPEDRNPCVKIGERIVDKEAVKDSLYQRIEDVLRDEEFYIPTREEIEDFAEHGYFSKMPGYEELHWFLRSSMKIGKWETEDLMREIYKKVQMGNELQEVLKMIDKWGIEISDAESLQQFADIMTEVNNNTRVFRHRGFTPNEMTERMKDTYDSYADEISVTVFPNGINGTPRTQNKKIYPNDPCPCGSGKKYKKCCGRK